MKIGILITARLKSTRLKEKVLKPILGRPMLHYMVERLRLAQRPSEIVICTSTIGQDDRLCEFAQAEGIRCFRGDPDDVLFRMLSAAEAFDVDTIVSCTADNPFVDPVYIDKLVDFHLAGDFDFSRIEGLPFGTFSYALKRDAIKKACEIKDEVDTEVWGGYFTQTGLFKCGVLEVVDSNVKWPELRLTVDTQEDFDMISEIFAKLYNSNSTFSLEEIVQLCRDNPELVALNSSVKQKVSLPIKLK
ncbi:hypothetical protein FEF65_09465 [Mariprofundus erugo]|uniref:3-deoxy-manno-octulosonate cytidylyltransferase n=1 Tax=Mariprofundus erugo TaxID=2528639 RepID=A0A5R9GM48_9PROT|nr:glycosyltransferase family protein [Mariprofundus erugo]TLS66738.1 hypothetical protein FEF65_09465 [Mariprofundus erugo]